jgi:hypothetical protein
MTILSQAGNPAEHLASPRRLVETCLGLTTGLKAPGSYRGPHHLETRVSSARDDGCVRLGQDQPPGLQPLRNPQSQYDGDRVRSAGIGQRASFEC